MNTSIHLDSTLFSGQTFAWVKQNGVYEAVVDKNLVSFSEESFDSMLEKHTALRHYFDMDGSTERPRHIWLPSMFILLGAIKTCKGLHILNQDPWEVLMVFLLSQNNNIKRIRSMYERLSKELEAMLKDLGMRFPVLKNCRVSARGI